MRVSQNILNALWAYAETRSLGREQVLGAGGLSDPAPGDDERVQAGVLYAAHRGLDRLLGEEAWALEIVQALPRGAYGLAEYIFRCQSSLGESLTKVVRYFSLLSEITELKLRTLHGGAVLEATHLDPEIRGELHRTLYQNLMSAVLHVAREITGEHLVPESVEFPFGPPGDARKYLEVFGVEPRFDAEAAALHFDARTTATPIVAADPNLREILERHANALLAARAGDDEFVSSVRRLVLKQLHGGDTSLETIARLLSMSNRSLQRKLGEAGYTFKTLLGEMRYTLARQCLEESRFSVDEIAFLLGYSDNSAFVKAFKRWSHTTPGQYRTRHVARQH